MKRSLEYKIRFQAVVIYVIVALIFAGTIVYIHYLRKDIDEQKETVRQYYNELTVANIFIDRINETQLEANRYASTRRIKHYRKFKENLAEVEAIVDSLSTFTQDSMRYQILHEVKGLLKEKGDIVMKLSREFGRSDYLDQIDEMKSSYREAVKSDSVLVATTIEDTIISTIPEKGFWRRLSDVFSSRKDTLVTKRILQTDTVRVPKSDTAKVIGGMSDFTEQIEESYTSRIADIEKQVNQLLNADHELSTKISHSLMVFYNHVIYKRLEEIQKSDQLVSKNSVFSLIGGVIALGLVLIFIVWIISDVNRSSSHRKVLEEANQRIKQTMQSRHQLLLSVSHDVKTPLNSILANLELNKDRGVFSQEDIRSMDNAGKHILSLLDNLLHFSSLEQGALHKEEHVFRLIDFCREISQLFSPLFLSKKLLFNSEFRFDRDLFVKADELRIKQIVINLLSNAVKYTRQGRTLFRVEYLSDRLHITVSDTGAGIPEEQMEKLFKPFSRVEQNNELAEGSGFGMYVVKGLVELLGGTISVQSVVNEGTTISVQIPVVKTEAPSSDFSPKRIGLIDDDPSFLQLLSRMLSRLGHLPEIINQVSELNPEERDPDVYDLILTDMEMGHVTGIDVLSQIRKYTGHVPVVVMTAQAGYDEDRAREAGFSAYLKKPVGLSSLRQLLGAREDAIDLQNLYEMFDDDSEAVNEILRIFVASTEENAQLLRQALDTDDFKAAGDLCHKMLPMFRQIGEKDATAILLNVEQHRSRRLPEYEGWKEEITELIRESLELIERIKKNYLQV